MSAVAEAERATAALSLRDLEIAYRVRGRGREVVRGISLEIGKQHRASGSGTHAPRPPECRPSRYADD